MTVDLFLVSGNGVNMSAEGKYNEFQLRVICIGFLKTLTGSANMNVLQLILNCYLTGSVDMTYCICNRRNSVC